MYFVPEEVDEPLFKSTEGMHCCHLVLPGRHFLFTPQPMMVFKNPLQKAITQAAFQASDTDCIEKGQAPNPRN